MKKLSFVVAAVAAIMFASCANKTAANQESDDSVSFEQSQIEAKVMQELDSLAGKWTELNPVEGVFENGKIQLSDDELKAKPDYLLDTKAADDLTLLSQKYRAIGIYGVDLKVAELYKMDTDAYKAVITKLAADVNDPAIKVNQPVTSEDIKAFYNAEKENGRLNLFWEASAASIVENLFVISQNLDKFLPAFTDASVEDITFHIQLLKLSLDDLATYDTNLKELDELLAPINELNAVNMEQFKEQLMKIKPQIETIRNQLLK